MRAVATAAHIRNVVSTCERKSLYELMFNKEPKIKQLRVFGCSAFALKWKGQLSKLDPKAVQAKFLGYSGERKAYILQEMGTKKVMFARNVVFMKHEVLSLDNKVQEIVDFPELPFSGGDIGNGDSASAEDKAQVEEIVTEEVEQVSVVEENPVYLPRDARSRQPPIRYGNAYAHSAVAIVEPASYEEAVSSNESKAWVRAMEVEVDALKSNETWSLVPRPSGKNVIPEKWV